jgi:molybdopterin-dependent oxidoreductase alpha subunit
LKQQFRRRIGPYREILRAAWQNRDRLGYAWNILNKGVCDGCALGTTGMRDWTMPDIHLCWIRLNLLRLNTMPALDPRLLQDLNNLEDTSEAGLRKLGRLPVPMIRRRGEPGFSPIAWEDALTMTADRIRAVDPRRVALYLVSRGTVNETYYAAQKAARAMGTSHIDNSARVCHSPSTVALKETIGLPATTCSYKDMLGTDLVVFWGSDVANNQPVTLKYLHMAKKAGTQVAMVNPFREPGMEKYWVPSNLDSALMGTRITDHYFPVQVGGDIAFINGVLKHLIANSWVDEQFVADHTVDWEELERELETQSFEDLEHHSGVTRETMLEFARLYANSRTTIFVWSMGITMHRHGVQNVKAIANLALARGMVGRPRTGLMAIRGHSGVQGGSEMGCGPNLLPGGIPLNAENAARIEKQWGFPVPGWKGDFISQTIDAAARNELDVLYAVGSNLFGILPDPDYVRGAVKKIPLRIHHDIVLNPQMLLDPADTVLLLPATTRYEMEGGNTETSTERRVIFNPAIPGPRIPDARDEWQVLMELARRVKPDLVDLLQFESTAAIRNEIARVVPFYDGIQHLSKQGDQFQWGGELLAKDGAFGFPDGKARFAPLTPPWLPIPDGWFRLSSRRGKQFNSMVFGERDMMIGEERDAVVLAEKEMERLGLTDGDPVLLRSKTGEFRGRAIGGAIQPGTVMMTWPEANALLPRGDADPVCGIPAYRDTAVEVIRAEG